MKQTFYILFATLLTTSVLQAQPQRVVSECTITYNLVVENADPALMQSLQGATKVVYIKGSKSRTDLVSSSYSSSIISDTRSDTTVVLRELGNARYISYLDKAKKQEQNRRFEGITFTPTGQNKTILGYNCVQAIAKLTDGTSYNVFYAPTLLPSNREYEYQFRNLPGLALEYEAESEDGKARFTFSAQKITLTPVPQAKFDLPRSGYRVL